MMKRKLTKKLSLNRRTVRVLDGEELTGVAGGGLIGSYHVCSTKEDLGPDCDFGNTDNTCFNCTPER